VIAAIRSKYAGIRGVKLSDRSYIYVPYTGLLRYSKSNIYIV